MEENINIQDYQDYKNVTVAEYVAAKSNVETKFIDSIKNGKLKEALKLAVLYIQLDKLFNKKIAYGQKYGYDGKGKNK